MKDETSSRSTKSAEELDNETAKKLKIDKYIKNTWKLLPEWKAQHNGNTKASRQQKQPKLLARSSNKKYPDSYDALSIKQGITRDLQIIGSDPIKG